MKFFHLFSVFSITSIFVCCVVFSPLSHATDFSTDVIGIKETHLSVNFWLTKLSNKKESQDKQSLLMNSAQIDNFNKQLIRDNPYISSPLSMPDYLTDVELKEKIKQISTVPSAERFYINGMHVSAKNYSKYSANTNQAKVQLNNKVLFALVVKRTGLRRFPTDDKVYKEAKDQKLTSQLPSALTSHSSNDSTHASTHTSTIYLTEGLEIHVEKDLDMFQESALFPGDAVAVLHTSTDGLWYLVQAYNYLAWLPKADVAIGSKTEISDFKSDANFLVVTGNKVFTHYVPDYVNNYSQLSHMQLDMGSRLPLAKREDYSNDLYGQNPYTSHVVKLPIKNVKGKLEFALVAIARSQDISIGYLPFTQRNLIEQSFKFLGERYGWGHDYNGRDCTGFIDEIYKSFGFIMPRNSGQQAKSPYGTNHFFDTKVNPKEKLATITKMTVGDLIYIPGHVMMYLGQDKGQPFVIHDVKELAYINETGTLYHGTLNGVSVTPLLPLQDYVNKITNIKRISAD